MEDGWVYFLFKRFKEALMDLCLDAYWIMKKQALIGFNIQLWSFFSEVESI